MCNIYKAVHTAVGIEILMLQLKLYHNSSFLFYISAKDLLISTSFVKSKKIRTATIALKVSFISATQYMNTILIR